MTLTFYYAPRTTASVTRVVLLELDQGRSAPLAEQVNLDLSQGDTRTEEYLKTVNPNGKLPAIVHDGVAIWESAAITIYLGETFGEAASLFPPAGPQRGEALKWIVWTNVTLATAGQKLMYLPGDEDSSKEKAKKDALDALGSHLAVADGALAKTGFLVGSQYSLVDSHLWAFVAWAGHMGVDMTPYTHLSAWKKKVEERPAVQEYLKS